MNTLNKEEIQQLIHDCHINGDHRLANTLSNLLQYQEAAEKPVYIPKPSGLWESDESIIELYETFKVAAEEHNYDK